MAKEPPLCPSAQPAMDGAVAFGVVGGTATEPEVAYLDEPLPVTPKLLQLAQPVRPTEVFRFAAPCAESGCRHFDGSECGLARKVASDVAARPARLPPCRIRPSCRWWQERGKEACYRCPAIVTEHYTPPPDLRVAADPEVA